MYTNKCRCTSLRLRAPVLAHAVAPGACPVLFTCDGVAPLHAATAFVKHERLAPPIRYNNHLATCSTRDSPAIAARSG